MVSSMLITDRARLPNEITANRETCKSAENSRALYHMATPLRRKANRYAFENGMTNVFHKEYSVD